MCFTLKEVDRSNKAWLQKIVRVLQNFSIRVEPFDFSNVSDNAEAATIDAYFEKIKMEIEKQTEMKIVIFSWSF